MNPNANPGLRRLLPPINSVGYFILLGVVAIFILGPLGGITAAYMNFSLGFFVGGQVLAGILGSAVTFGYGADGKHGANYMQTMAASVASMSGMGVLLQAMAWLGLPEPPIGPLIIYYMAIGLFGVGLGMLYTPVLVDRMQLPYPSGLAVANILRALTDARLLRRSIGQLGGGTLLGFIGGMLASLAAQIQTLGWASAGGVSWVVKTLQDPGISTSTLGAGMVVGARIAIPAFLVGTMGVLLTPWLRAKDLIGPNDPFRKISFIVALGMILGAALVDLTVIGFQAVQRLRQVRQAPAAPTEDWRRVNTFRLVLWTIFWGGMVIWTGHVLLHQPMMFLVLAVLLATVFLMVNGISLGISDSNPISSAFVIAVFLMASLGLKDAQTGLMCASILLIACAVGGDMQQDRSTGWRLGTNRVIQFRFQVIGILMGAVLAVVLARLFMEAYEVLAKDMFSNPNLEGAKQWQSAMTYKFVGTLRGLTNPKPHIMTALYLGIGIGLVTEVLRKALKSCPSYERVVRSGKTGFATGFVFDAIVLPSPYASSFGGFVDFTTSAWFAVGGILSSLIETLRERRAARNRSDDLPADMNVTSLVGGGLIGGDSLAALSIGVAGLLHTLWGR
jgi:uncharacterized oligopeptide transporter (OPT) family protein